MSTSSPATEPAGAAPAADRPQRGRVVAIGMMAAALAMVAALMRVDERGGNAAAPIPPSAESQPARDAPARSPLGQTGTPAAVPARSSSVGSPTVGPLTLVAVAAAPPTATPTAASSPEDTHDVPGATGFPPTAWCRTHRLPNPHGVERVAAAPDDSPHAAGRKKRPDGPAVILFTSPIDGPDPVAGPARFPLPSSRNEANTPARSPTEVQRVAALLLLRHDGGDGCARDVYLAGDLAPGTPLLHACETGSASRWNANFLACIGHVAGTVLTAHHTAVVGVELLRTPTDTNWTGFVGTTCAAASDARTTIGAVYRPAAAAASTKKLTVGQRNHAVDDVLRYTLQRSGANAAMAAPPVPLAGNGSAKAALPLIVPTRVAVPACLFHVAFHAANAMLVAPLGSANAGLVTQGAIDGINAGIATLGAGGSFRCLPPAAAAPPAPAAAAAATTTVAPRSKSAEHPPPAAQNDASPLPAPPSLASPSAACDAYWPRSLNDTRRLSAGALCEAFASPPWRWQLPKQEKRSGSRQEPQARVAPTAHSFYPPAVYVLQKSWDRVQSRPYLAAYMAELRRVFRRLVVVTKGSVPGFNDAYGPAPDSCFHKAFVPLCWQRMLNTPEVRLSGGLLMVHADLFFDPRALFEGRGGDAAEHILAPRQTPGADGRKLRPDRLHYVNVSATWGNSWELTSSGTTRPQVDQRNRAAARIAAFAPVWLTDHAAADRVWRKRDSQSNSSVGEEDIDEGRGFFGSIGPLVLNQGDMFYLPDRAFNLAADLLDAFLPTTTTSEPAAGWIAEMLHRAFGGRRSLAVTPSNYKWRSRRAQQHGGAEPPPPSSEESSALEWRHVPYAGGCCSKMDVSDIESARWTVGHKVRLNHESAVRAMTRRLTRSFTCQAKASLVVPSAEAAERFKEVWPTAMGGPPAPALYHTPSPCAVAATGSETAGGSNSSSAGVVVVVAPNSLQVDVRMPNPASHVVLHTPSAHSVSVRLPWPAEGAGPPVRVTMRTGVVAAANVSIAAADAAAVVHGCRQSPGAATTSALNATHDAFTVVCRGGGSGGVQPLSFLAIRVVQHQRVEVIPEGSLCCAFARN